MSTYRSVLETVWLRLHRQLIYIIPFSLEMKHIKTFFLVQRVPLLYIFSSFSALKIQMKVSKRGKNINFLENIYRHASLHTVPYLHILER